MSRYLIVVHDDSAAGTLDAWLASHSSDPTEQWTTRLNGTYTLRIVSPDVAAGVRGRTFFSGTAWSEQDGFVAFDAAGYARAPQARSGGRSAGAFVQAEWSRSEVRIANDVLGTVPVMQAHGPGFVAFSDSLLVLADLRGRFGLVNTPNAEALLARTGLSWRTAQIASPETVVSQITMLAPGSGLTVQATRPLLVDADPAPLGAPLRSDDDAVTDLRSSAGFLVGTMRALPASVPSAVQLGSERDQVLVDALRLAEPSGALPTQVDAVAAARATDAGSAAAAVVPDAAPPASLVAWAASGLGLQDVVVPSVLPDDVAGDETVAVDLVGNALLRRVWGEETVGGMRESAGVPDTAVDAYAAQVEKGLRAVGADPSLPSASQRHYAAYRAPRFAAAARSGRAAVHPLQTATSVGAAAVGDRFPGVDALYALATLLHTDAGTTEGAAAAGRRTLTLAEIGGALRPTEIPAVEVLGAPGGTSVRSTRLATGIARARGLGGATADPAVAIVFMGDLLDVLPADVRPAYESVLGNARWHLVDRGEGLREAGPAVGKILSLVLFAA